MSFLPTDFIPPARIEQDQFIVRPIHINDTFKDYEAVMGSYDHLRSLFGEAWGWPSKSLSLEQNMIDLGWHYKEYQLKSSFDYAVMSKDDSKLLGCIYIDPCDLEAFDAEVYYWGRADELQNGLEDNIRAFTLKWLEESWPFATYALPGRDISWDKWNSLSN